MKCVNVNFCILLSAERTDALNNIERVMVIARSIEVRVLLGLLL